MGAKNRNQSNPTGYFLLTAVHIGVACSLPQKSETQPAKLSQSWWILLVWGMAQWRASFLSNSCITSNGEGSEAGSQLPQPALRHPTTAPNWQGHAHSELALEPSTIPACRRDQKSRMKILQTKFRASMSTTLRSPSLLSLSANTILQFSVHLTGIHTCTTWAGKKRWKRSSRSFSSKLE